MPRVIVATSNPAKIRAVREGFARMFPDETFEIEGAPFPSSVSEQPKSDAETLQGAWNRAENASKGTEADFWAGLESGIEEKGGEMEAFAWIVVKAKDGRFGKGRTGTFFLPPKVAELIRGGMELGVADDIVFGKSDSKRSNGVVGLLTHDAVTRASYYAEAIVFALIPFKNPSLYPSGDWVSAGR